MSTIAQTPVAHTTLARAAGRACVHALAGDLATDSRGTLCLMFPSRTAHDAFLEALRAEGTEAADTVLKWTFPGQATGKLTILNPAFSEYAVHGCVLIYCPHATLQIDDQRLPFAERDDRRHGGGPTTRAGGAATDGSHRRDP